MTAHTVPIIGYHHAALSQKFGAPRQPNLVGLSSMIEMVAPYDTPAACAGLDDFSHIWITWQCHHNEIKKANHAQAKVVREQAQTPFRAQVRPPRLGGNQKIGVFASRSMYRPSALGLSVVKLDRVEIVAGRVLLMISGADMIAGTPIIDIKPYITYSDTIVGAQSSYAADIPPLLAVTISDSATAQFMQIVDEQRLANIQHNPPVSIAACVHQMTQQLVVEDKAHISALIAQDPRPAYRSDEIRVTFTMRYKSVDVSFWQLETGQLQITTIAVINPS